MILVFFNNFFNWIKNVGGIKNSMLMNFYSEIWNNVENFYYFLFYSNQLIIFAQVYLKINLTLFKKKRFYSVPKFSIVTKVLDMYAA